MNRHVERVEARDRRNRLDRFLAACITALFLGLCAGQVRAQDISIGANVGNGGFPSGAVPIASGATGTTGTVTATIPALTNHYSYICGFSVSFLENVTGGTTSGPITVTGLSQGQTFTFQLAAVAASGSSIFTVNFPTCLPGNASNSAITVNSTANAQATAVDVNAWGFQQ